jgi:hypothetical protein
LAGTLTWNSFGLLKALPSYTFTNRSSELNVPAVKVVCASCAAVSAKVVPAAFQNCVLRTTIYRRVHLQWSVGD